MSLSSLPSKLKAPERIAGIDYGTVRIGIALADRETRIATPYENYQRTTLERDASYFKKFAAEERIALLVVGLPVHMSGNESQKSAEARQFGEWLQTESGVPVVYFDERYTSSQADELLDTAGLTSKQRKARRDMLAAQILLTAYLEAVGRGGEGIEALE
jgi:putative Holliday junction resolvase